MFSCLSSFHTSFSSPHLFFIDTSVELFPLSKSTSDIEIAQSALAPINLNQLFVSNNIPKPTPDTPLRRSTRSLEKTHTWDYVDLPYVASTKQWPLLQMDVKNDFLSGTLFEEVYIKSPHCTSPSSHKLGFASSTYVLRSLHARHLMSTQESNDSNTASTSLDPNVHLTPFDGVPFGRYYKLGSITNPTLHKSL
ncbi:putative mitochondrial protein [Cucumis melo var. makuwa]|uniref:Mitochondrial protein n=1 Tax=Cucumis melo var. makuwa TaxID=1194695 RepID=A0A5D3E6D3_CUCMM|nr:putative mitochondrial protein [Cucumis melo var. makuwa]TYK31534.1 putative mitochondrial protein [Cucumis melo var. makuwa]